MPEVQERLFDHFGIATGQGKKPLGLAPAHNIQAVTPIENILAVYDAAREYGAFA